VRTLLSGPEDGQPQPPEPSALEIRRARIKELLGELVDLLVV